MDTCMHRLFVCIVPALLLAGCSEPGSPSSSSPASSTSVQSSSSPATSPATKCQELTADIPPDLTNSRVHVAEEDPPRSLGVIWTNADGSRVANISTAKSNEPFGHGFPGKPTKRRVQGQEAEEFVVDGVSIVMWRQENSSGPCPFWAAVSQGLSDPELNALLESVREAA